MQLLSFMLVIDKHGLLSLHYLYADRCVSFHHHLGDWTKWSEAEENPSTAIFRFTSNRWQYWRDIFQLSKYNILRMGLSDKKYVTNFHFFRLKKVIKSTEKWLSWDAEVNVQEWVSDIWPGQGAGQIHLILEQELPGYSNSFTFIAYP